MAEDNIPPDGEADKHQRARQLAEKALHGDMASTADAWGDEALRADPAAADTVLEEASDEQPARASAIQDDEEVARITREIHPNSGARSRGQVKRSGRGYGVE